MWNIYAYGPERTDGMQNEINTGIGDECQNIEKFGAIEKL